MRKREQELLAKIKEQQKELDAVKAEKTKVEKELTRSEREREDDRRLMIEKERVIERQRVETVTQERDTGYRRPYDRVLTREKASPAHLRGRRPPSLVSDENDEEVRAVLATAPTTVTIPIIKSNDTPLKPPTLASHEPTDDRSATTASPATPAKSQALQRRSSLRRSTKPDPSGPTATLGRSQSFRVKKDSNNAGTGDSRARVPASPASSRRGLNTPARDRRETASPVKLQRTPSWRRKAETLSENKSTSKPIGLVITRECCSSQE